MLCCKSFGFCPIFLVVTIAGAATLLSAQTPEPPAQSPPPASAAKPEPKGDPYTLDTCIVSGEKLGSMGKPVVKEIDGREVRFCCKGCVGLYEKDAATYHKKLDDKVIEQQLKHYPLSHCVVMEDEELTDAAVNYVYKNRLVRFCCKECIKPFNEDPAKHIAKLNAAVIKQQKEEYPLDTCPMTGEKLDEDAVDKVVGVTLIRFCCSRCAAKFALEPAPVIARVHEAWKAKHAAEGDPHTGKDGR